MYCAYFLHCSYEYNRGVLKNSKTKTRIDTIADSVTACVSYTCRVQAADAGWQNINLSSEGKTPSAGSHR